VTTAGDYRVFFGWRSDPFFFDANGLFNNMQFTGDDFFADKDVCSIALELPNSALGIGAVGLWACTLEKTGNGWVQADRGGRPLQAVSSQARQGSRISTGSQPMTIALLVSARMNWNMRAAIQMRSPGVSRERCCLISSPMILGRWRPFPATGGHSPTMWSTCSSQCSRTER